MYIQNQVDDRDNERRDKIISKATYDINILELGLLRTRALQKWVIWGLGLIAFLAVVAYVNLNSRVGSLDEELAKNHNHLALLDGKTRNLEDNMVEIDDYLWEYHKELLLP